MWKTSKQLPTHRWTSHFGQKFSVFVSFLPSGITLLLQMVHLPQRDNLNAKCFPIRSRFSVEAGLRPLAQVRLTEHSGLAFKESSIDCGPLMCVFFLLHTVNRLELGIGGQQLPLVSANLTLFPYQLILNSCSNHICKTNGFQVRKLYPNGKENCWWYSPMCPLLSLGIS